MIDIPKYIYDTVVEYTIVDADKDEIQKAIRNGQILPDNVEILTADAYSDLCLRASKLDEFREKIEKERKYLLDNGMNGAEHILVHHCLRLLDDEVTED